MKKKEKMVAIPFVEVTETELVIESAFRCPRNIPEKSYGIILETEEGNKNYWSVTVCHADSFYIHNRQRNKTWYFRVVDGKAKHVCFLEDIKADCWETFWVVLRPFMCLWEFFQAYVTLLKSIINMFGFGPAWPVLLIPGLFLLLGTGLITCHSPVVSPKQAPNVMYPGLVLSEGQSLQVTEDYTIRLYDCRIQRTGPFAVYLTPNLTFKCSKKWYLKFQGDGNLVLYDDGGLPRWASDTGGKGYSRAWVDTKNNKFLFA